MGVQRIFIQTAAALTGNTLIQMETYRLRDSENGDLYELAAGAVWDLEASIGATGAVQLVLAELDGRGHLVQHLVQDSLQLQAAQLGELLIHIPASTTMPAYR